jgi:hypothetical protein
VGVRAIARKSRTPKILKYVAREILNVRYTGLRRVIPRHLRGNLSNRAASVDKLNEGQLDGCRHSDRALRNLTPDAITPGASSSRCRSSMPTWSTSVMFVEN